MEVRVGVRVRLLSLCEHLRDPRPHLTADALLVARAVVLLLQAILAQAVALRQGLRGRARVGVRVRDGVGVGGWGLGLG